MKFRVLPVVLLAGALAACGDDDSNEGKKQALIELWKGAEPHFWAKGSIQGVDFEFELSAEHAANIDFLNLARKYCVPDTGDPSTWSQGYIYDVDLNVRDRNANSYISDALGLPGYDKFEVSFEGKDFQVAAQEGEITVVPDTATLAPKQATIQLTIKDNNQPDGVAVVDPETWYSGYAETGSLVIGQWTGNPADGKEPPEDEGTVGGVVSVRFSTTDELIVSFSSYAEENKLKDPVSESDECKF